MPIMSQGFLLTIHQIRRERHPLIFLLTGPTVTHIMRLLDHAPRLLFLYPLLTLAFCLPKLLMTLPPYPLLWMICLVLLVGSLLMITLVLKMAPPMTMINLMTSS
jgi:hypothetical protein